MTVKPAYSGLILLRVTITMLSLSWVFVILRVIARARTRAFGLDDSLMCLGLVFFSGTCSLIIVTCYHGAGYPSSELDDGNTMLVTKLYLPAMIIYAAASLAIKGSICVALLRIGGVRRAFVWSIYVILALSVITFVVFTIGVLNICHPIHAMWKHDAGTCDPDINIGMGYFISAMSIFTDWSLAILPVFMVWNMKMKKKIKLLVAFILALAATASCATIVRLRFILLYGNTSEYPTAIAKITIWSFLEEGIGIIAGSLPMLRPLLVCSILSTKSSTSAPKSPFSITTWGSSKRRHGDNILDTNTNTQDMDMYLGETDTYPLAAVAESGSSREPCNESVTERTSQRNPSPQRGILKQTSFTVDFGENHQIQQQDHI